MSLRKESGFTMIELLVVLAILAILIILMITQLNIHHRIEQALGLRATVQLNDVKQALDRYYVNHNCYPGNVNEAGVNVIVPDELNHTLNPSGNYYIQPTPATTATQELVADKELSSSALHVKLNSSHLGEINNFLFLAVRELSTWNACESYVNGSGQILSQPKVCKKLTTQECHQIKTKISQGDVEGTKDYYTICEAGGAMVAIIPLSGVNTSSDWYAWACDPSTTEFQYWIYYCR